MGLLLIVVLAPQLNTVVVTSLVILILVAITSDGLSPFFPQVEAPHSNLGSSATAEWQPVQ